MFRPRFAVEAQSHAEKLELKVSSVSSTPLPNWKSCHCLCQIGCLIVHLVQNRILLNCTHPLHLHDYLAHGTVMYLSHSLQFTLLIMHPLSCVCPGMWRLYRSSFFQFQCAHDTIQRSLQSLIHWSRLGNLLLLHHSAP